MTSALERAIQGSAAVLAGYIGRLVERGVVRDPGLFDEAIRAALGGAVGRRVVLCYFMADVVPIMALSMACPARSVVSGVRWVCDDSTGGEVAAKAINRLGGRTFCLPWASVGGRIRALGALRKMSELWGISVDGHGPYGVVNPALARFLVDIDAVVVPVASVVRPQVAVRLRAKLKVPLLWSVVAGAVGPVVDVREAGVGSADVLTGRLLRLSEL